MTPAEITSELRRLSTDARSAAIDQDDLTFIRCVGPLADALDLAADLLEQQQRFLIDLRNWKADA